MKSDGSLVSLAHPEVPHLTNSFRTCGLDTLTQQDSMVPCKQPPSPSSPTFPRYKESDSNGNDIRGDKNMTSENSLCGSEDGDKTDVSQLTHQVCHLQQSLSSLQQETDTTITKLRQELADKASIVETLQQQIRMKMFINMTKQPSPVMAALADLHGSPGRVPDPGPNEEMLASWRKSLEQSLLAGFPFPLDQGRNPLPSPLSRSVTPHQHDRMTPLDPRTGSKTPSDDGRGSPCGSSESRSPRKQEEGVSPTPSPVPSFPGLPGLPGLPKSFHPSSPLSIPPHFTSRIPKGDPLEERLHDMLRYNMEKFAGQPIDTLADSRRVRELLSVHNIGQRLFAKYVLGLSQGTVSELLSKPKSWDKLTEKGRDSYRKMHAWVWDDQAILLLKTLIPRKGELLRSSSSAKQGTWHLTQPISGALQEQQEEERPEDRNSEHRINRILSEVSKSQESSLPAALLPKFPISLEAVRESQGLLPSLPPAPNPDDLKLAFTFYQAEINQLKKLPNSQEQFEEEKREQEQQEQQEESDKEEEVLKEERDREEEMSRSPAAGHHSPFSMLQAKLEQFPRGPPIFPGPNFMTSHGMEGNPLSMMASITNSLVSQPLPNPMQNMKMKAVLPPITQQQFDHFSHLNTDDVVRRIKEILSQYSISQRLFGEAVLGLSQGSVSDLLARPKPWHMLTQKGREPFIRMKLFLDDETAVNKLVASQYKIVPEKLLRQGVYNGQQNMSPFQICALPAGVQAKLGQGLQGRQQDFRGLNESPLPALIPNSPRLPPQILNPLDRSLLSSLPISPRGLPSLPHLTPNLYEMAALTQEFDTTLITNKVKELLLANNTGQKLFGEAVLGLSQGSVSELLSKPKPWHMLSIKGREPFIRMQLWLNDPANMDKLLAIKNLQEESRRRKRTFDESFSGKSSPSDISDLYSNPGGVRSPEGEAKRARGEGGLDLSFRREEEGESEGEREGEVRVEEEEGRETESDDGASRPSGGRSRRKPAAPQWVNPSDWAEERGEEGDDKTINGVCVMNTSAVYPPEETVD